MRYSAKKIICASMSTLGENRELTHNCQAFIDNAKELKQRNPIGFNSLFSGSSSQIISRPVINKLGWWVLNPEVAKFNMPKLKVFYILLLHYRYITSTYTYEEFEKHFIGDDIPKGKIVWEGEIMILVLLFNILIHEKGVIPHTAESLYDLLDNHFLRLNKKDKSIHKLKPRSLISSLNKSKRNSSVEKDVSNLIILLVSQ